MMDYFDMLFKEIKESYNAISNRISYDFCFSFDRNKFSRKKNKIRSEKKAMVRLYRCSRTTRSLQTQKVNLPKSKF